MASGVLVSTGVSVDGDRLQFGVRSYPRGEGSFVVLELGRSDVTMHVFDLATLTALAAMVAEAKDVLTAALAGQDRLPVEPALVSA